MEKPHKINTALNMHQYATFEPVQDTSSQVYGPRYLLEPASRRSPGSPGSPSLTKRPPAGRTGGFLGARAARAVASVCMREDAAARRGLQCHREPRSTCFWNAAYPLSPTGHCAARGSRAHHRLDQLADWPRSAVRFIYCRLKPCDDACAHARSFASTWELPTNSRATGVFSPRRIHRSNVARAQTNSRITPIRARNEKGAYWSHLR